jgi:hypothetical protein
LKAFFGRYYSNAGHVAVGVDPVGNSWVRYKFLDPNNNGVYDGQQELGAFVTSGGGAAGQTLSPDFQPMYADEFSFAVEHELKADTGIRFSYVRKQLRNSWANAGSPYYNPVNLARTTDLMTQNVDLPCVDCPGGFEGSTLHLRTLPPGAPTNNVQIAQAPGDTDGNYDTIQFAFDRRFSQSLFANASFDYQWRHELRSPDDNNVGTSPLSTDPIGYWWSPEYNREISQIQDTTYWNFKGGARYEAGHQLGLAGTVRIMSGFPWAPIAHPNIPIVGA